jgi:membrane-bound lytic murein transglycosylase D
MDVYLDERKDPYASSYAVAQYLSEAYDQFGDWLLAIASYNCGRGGVQRAIARSGIERPTFWELAPYLPSETRNYVPKYIAMTYAMEMAEFYDIEVADTELSMESKVMMLDKTVDMKHIANAANVSLEQLKKYNPAYKRTVINGTVERPKRLVLPITEGLNDSLLYLALNTNTSPVTQMEQLASYTVRPGETIQDVAEQFRVSVQDLRAWNNLTSKSNIVGKTLILSQDVDPKLASNMNKVAAKKSGGSVIYYTVKKGDSLDRIASRHKGTTVAKLKSDNNLKSNLIRPGMKLKVRVL